MPRKIVPYVIELDEDNSTNHEKNNAYIPSINAKMQKIPAKFHLSLCGCGFLGIYHLGAISSLVKNGRYVLQKTDRVVGASAGALVASVLVVKQDKIQDCINFTHNLAAELRSKPAGALTPGYNLMKPLQKFLDSSLPEDAHLKASGRLFISLTNIKTRKNEIFSEYKDKQELIKCLLASSYIPLYGGVKPPKIRGKRYIDGGFTNNLPVFDDGFTVRISPFCGGQEIAPRDRSGMGLYFNMQAQDFQVNLHNVGRALHAFFPPSQKVLNKYYNRGYRDAERFLKSNNLYQKALDNTDSGRPSTREIVTRETSV